MVHKVKKGCEACDYPEVQWELVDKLGTDKTYKVCSNCLLPLVGHALSKKQFNKLLKSSHKRDEFLLHSDFYSEQGEAMQPTEFR
jgi:hypothetical protein